MPEYARYALQSYRTLRRNGLFTFVTVLTTAIGISAQLTIFSLISVLLLKKPPITDPDDVVVAGSVFKAQGWGSSPRHKVSLGDYLYWRENSKQLNGMAAVQDGQIVDLTADLSAERVLAVGVTPNFFQVLGVQPAVGRGFADDLAGERQVMISSDLWQRSFHSDKTIVGSSVRVNGREYTVVGIMPAVFSLSAFPAQIWMPLDLHAPEIIKLSRSERPFYVVARLTSRGGAPTAQAELTTIAESLAATVPEDRGWSARLLSLQEFQIEDQNVRPALLILVGFAAIVFFIAVANTASLLLARGFQRQREIAVRFALGATARPLMQQFLSEALVLATIASSIGLVLTVFGIRLLKLGLAFSETAARWPLGLDNRVLLFLILLWLIVVLLFSITISFQVRLHSICDALRGSIRSTSELGIGARARYVIVTGQLIAVFVALVASSILTQYIYNEFHARFGFDHDNILTAELHVSDTEFPTNAQRVAFIHSLVSRLRSLPQVKEADVASALPLTGADWVHFSNGETPAGDSSPRARLYLVGRGYFSTMRISFYAGRSFAPAEGVSSDNGIVVNQEFAARIFPRLPLSDVLGQRILFAGPIHRSLMIIGIVGNVKEFLGQSGYDPQVYISYYQYPSQDVILAVRSSPEWQDFASSLRGIVRDVNRHQTIGSVLTMAQVIDVNSGGGERFMAGCLATSSTIILILAMVGLYGLITFFVATRRRDIGLRMALGASRRQVVGFVFREGVRLLVVGITLGGIASCVIPPLLRSLYYDIHISVIVILLVVPVFVFLIGMTAVLMPALEAAKCDPMAILRSE